MLALLGAQQQSSGLQAKAAQKRRVSWVHWQAVSSSSGYVGSCTRTPVHLDAKDYCNQQQACWKPAVGPLARLCTVVPSLHEDIVSGAGCPLPLSAKTLAETC